MLNQSSLKTVNPNLKTSYSTFTSAILATVVLLTIFEWLGVKSIWLGYLMISVPVIAYILIGIISRTVLLSEYYVSGRRVPALYNGMALAVATLGGVGFFAFTGAFVAAGYDALPLLYGLAGGLVIMAIFFAPYLRKFGAYTLPSFMAERYKNPLLHIITALLLIIPSMMLLVAEFRVGAEILAQFTSASYETLIVFTAVILLVTLLPGGMRGLTWSQAAQFIVVLIGFLAPLVILSVQYTYLPIPQLSYGALLSGVTETEAMNGAVNLPRNGTLIDYFATSTISLEKNFSEIFGKLSAFEFLTLSLAIMMGVAVMPALLARSNLSINIAEMRHSMNWALLLLGVILISIPPFAVFVKFLALKSIVGQQIQHLPDWVINLLQAGLLQIEDINQDGKVSLRELTFSRDGIPLSLPNMEDIPFVIVGLVAIAGVSAVLAAAGAHILLITHALSHDIIHKFVFPNASKTRQLVVTRLMLITILLGVTFFAISRQFDILWLYLVGTNIAASTFFAPLILSIWFNRSSGLGVIAAMITGFSLSLVMIYLTEYIGLGSLLGFSAATFAILVTPISLAVGIVISRLQGTPDPEIIEIGENLRVARGETLFDRAIRLSSRKR